MVQIAVVDKLLAKAKDESRACDPCHLSVGYKAPDEWPCQISLKLIGRQNIAEVSISPSNQFIK